MACLMLRGFLGKLTLMGHLWTRDANCNIAKYNGAQGGAHTMSHAPKRTDTIPKFAYSIQELVQGLGIGRTKLYALLRQGRLKAIRIDKRTLVTAQDLDAFIDSLRAA